MKVVIVDYGIGNIFSVCSALTAIKADFIVSSDPLLIEKADRLILPGVGSFDRAAEKLREFGLDEVIIEYTLKGNPFLGICVGMQLLMEHGEEGHGSPGLGLIKGKVQKINDNSTFDFNLPIPHISWAEVCRKEIQPNFLYKIAEQKLDMYFVHSYHCVPDNKEDIKGITFYGENEITAMVQKDNIIGTQFHPERSGPIGLMFLERFLQYQ